LKTSPAAAFRAEKFVCCIQEIEANETRKGEKELHVCFGISFF